VIYSTTNRLNVRSNWNFACNGLSVDLEYNASEKYVHFTTCERRTTALIHGYLFVAVQYSIHFDYIRAGRSKHIIRYVCLFIVKSYCVNGSIWHSIYAGWIRLYIYTGFFIERQSRNSLNKLIWALYMHVFHTLRFRWGK
jgi:hypothetical protein